MHRVDFTPDAEADLARLDTPIAQRALKKLHWLAENLDAVKPEALTGEWQGVFKLRVGDHRVLYTVDRAKQRVIAHFVRHRREVYKIKMKTQLTNDEKHLIDVLLSLQTHAFNSLNERRRYEWRLSISFWTALVVLLGFLLKGEITAFGLWVNVGLTIGALFIVWSHRMWMIGAGRRNGADVRVAYFWEEKTRQLLDTDYPDELRKEHRALRGKSGSFWTYSFSFQFIITALLALAIIWAVWALWWQQRTQEPAGDDSSNATALAGTRLDETHELCSSRVPQTGRLSGRAGFGRKTYNRIGDTCCEFRSSNRSPSAA